MAYAHLSQCQKCALHWPTMARNSGPASSEIPGNQYHEYRQRILSLFHNPLKIPNYSGFRYRYSPSIIGTLKRYLSIPLPFAGSGECIASSASFEQFRHPTTQPTSVKNAAWSVCFCRPANLPCHLIRPRPSGFITWRPLRLSPFQEWS